MEFVNFGNELFDEDPTRGVGFTSALEDLPVDIVADGANVRMAPGDEGKMFVTAKRFNGRLLTPGGGADKVFKSFAGSVALKMFGDAGRASIVAFAAPFDGIGLPPVAASDLKVIASLEIEDRITRLIDFDMIALFPAIRHTAIVGFFVGIRAEDVPAECRVKLRGLKLKIAASELKIGDN